MSKVKMTIELDSELALKLPTFKEKVENGGNMLVVDGSVRGEIMAWIVQWLTLHRDEVNTTANQDNCNQLISVLTEKDTCFMNLVFLQGDDFLVELLQAAHYLKIWPLFDICCKVMADSIKVKSAAEVRQFLKLDEATFKLSAPCIKGFLKYLPAIKRLELDAIDSTEWQEASIRLWSEQEILIFSKRGVKFVMPAVNACTHIDQTVALAMNCISYTEQDLAANLESIKTKSQRKMPEKFLTTIRKCHNLRVLLWDKLFGQMANPKLARVLEHFCPKLEHIQGTVQRSFEFKDEGIRICPASFLDIFEPKVGMSCNLVTCIQEDDTKKDRIKKRKVDELFELKDLKKQRLVKENAIKESKVKHEQMKKCEAGRKNLADLFDTLGMKDINYEYTDDDFETLTNFRLFYDHVLPLIVKANPSPSSRKLNRLISEKWREFIALSLYRSL